MSQSLSTHKKRSSNSTRMHPETAQSAQMSRSLRMGSGGKKVSAFTLTDCNEEKNKEHIDAVAEINYQYAKLYNKIVREKGEMMGIRGEKGLEEARENNEEETDEPHQRSNEAHSTLQKYQEQCKKTLKKIETNLHTLTHHRILLNSLALLESSLQLSPTLPLSSLISHYESLCHQLPLLQQKHKSTIDEYRSIVGETQILEYPPSSFKVLAHELNKVMQMEQYYEDRCREQESILEKREGEICRVKESKKIIEMYSCELCRKLVAEQARRDRTLRKMKERERGRSVKKEETKNTHEKVKDKRSKSVVKF